MEMDDSLMDLNDVIVHVFYYGSRIHNFGKRESIVVHNHGYLVVKTELSRDLLMYGRRGSTTLQEWTDYGVAFFA